MIIQKVTEEELKKLFNCADFYKEDSLIFRKNFRGILIDEREGLIIIEVEE